MRIPLTLSELSVIRSGGRIFVQLFGVLAVLLGLWGATVMIDRSMAPLEDDALIDTEGFAPSLTFPAETTLRHEDGRTLSVILINRPSSDEVTIQRKRDGRTFILDLNILESESAAQVRKFALENDTSSIQALIDSFQGHLQLPETVFELPHRCTLVSVEGIALPVTLLRREDTNQIRFRRMQDGKIFTIPLERLVESDRQLIRQFPLDLPEETTVSFGDG